MVRVAALGGCLVALASEGSAQAPPQSGEMSALSGDQAGGPAGGAAIQSAVTPASVDAAAQQTSPPPPPEDTVSEPARLSDVEGSVRILDRDGKLFDQARLNMQLDAGMRVETGNDGRAEIEFPDGTLARVAPNSVLSFAAFNPDPGSATPVTLKPLSGLTYYEFASRGSQVSVQIGPLWAFASRGAGEAATGTAERALLRVNLDTSPYQAATLRGAVHLQDEAGNAPLDLVTGQTAKIDPSSATNYDIAQEVTPDSWDAWNADRDSALAEVEGAGAHSSTGEPDSPGWDDLDYYGSWYNVPGQGLAWAPDGVDESFDPYGSGAWGYTAGTGYSWISSYPWGWLPYHCGYWNYYAGGGWMWLPSGCAWGRGRGHDTVWYPYVGVHAAPFGYRPPMRPVPPRGINHPPATATLIAIHRGPEVRYRAVGAPRPEPRTLEFAGDHLAPLQTPARPAYDSFPSGVGGAARGRTSGSLPPGAAEGRIAEPGYARAPISRPPPAAPRYTPPPQPVYSAPTPVVHSAPSAGSHPK